MKRILLVLSFSFFAFTSFSQNAGNLNHPNARHMPTHQAVKIPSSQINVNFGDSRYLLIQAKGLYNLKADSYVALFHLSQTAKDAEEVNQLIDARIDKVKEGLKGLADISLHTDMLSFVPVYEFAEEKKVFSKKTYTEIPAGFELKKNLHISYKDPNILNDLIRICSEAEIYELIRV
ncbi:MAG: SIMPL domain-containing protein, partial [Bacteroidota bacterium]